MKQKVTRGNNTQSEPQPTHAHKTAGRTEICAGARGAVQFTCTHTISRSGQRFHLLPPLLSPPTPTLRRPSCAGDSQPRHVTHDVEQWSAARATSRLAERLRSGGLRWHHNTIIGPAEVWRRATVVAATTQQCDMTDKPDWMARTRSCCTLCVPCAALSSFQESVAISTRGTRARLAAARESEWNTFAPTGTPCPRGLPTRATRSSPTRLAPCATTSCDRGIVAQSTTRESCGRRQFARARPPGLRSCTPMRRSECGATWSLAASAQSSSRSGKGDQRCHSGFSPSSTHAGHPAAPNPQLRQQQPSVV